jgi:hypothetical protein
MNISIGILFQIRLHISQVEIGNRGFQIGNAGVLSKVLAKQWRRSTTRPVFYTYAWTPQLLRIGQRWCLYTMQQRHFGTRVAPSGYLEPRNRSFEPVCSEIQWLRVSTRNNTLYKYHAMLSMRVCLVAARRCSPVRNDARIWVFI